MDQFGEAYDDGSPEFSARARGQVRAKAALLEVSESTTARLRTELSEVSVAAAAAERALQAALAEAHAAVEELRLRLNDAEAEASHQRATADDLRSALAALTLEYHGVCAQLRAADEAKRNRGAALDDARAATLASEAERATLQSLLDEERSGLTLKRLEQLLTSPYAPASSAASATQATVPSPSPEAVDAPLPAAVGARLADLARTTEKRVQAAEAEAARLQLALNSAPTAEALSAQAQAANDARAVARALGMQLKEAARERRQAEAAAAAACERAGAAEAEREALSQCLTSAGVSLPEAAAAATPAAPAARSLASFV
ncbi:hypothetical protein Ctob_011383 [Chrysochromulina tobinii]|uniref:Uncharacterized protein n=1 Tax=Chrysochromulina tobinii TaxID=1460289 RepID=A0A0M0KAP5_9EUKA|nr:hypothetical protein Ctob_011383 [Chrysochromulina tobinii]|eukprot:KOO35916.1 hypothetical protein Ctob_011383 [Chrysochromulina sp. CCMP291]